jgi:hypothetical protein
MLRTTRVFRLPYQIALVALALCATAVMGKSQDSYQGTFTLPFEAHWAGATLPAGEYTISIPTVTTSYLLYVRGQGKSAIIMAAASNTKAVSDHSHLTVVNTGGREAITSLEAGQLGMTFDYAVFKSKATAESNETKAETETNSTSRVNVPVREIGVLVAGR